jgi:hypothetical protein
MAAGWSFTTQSVGLTPSMIRGSAIDDPGLVNVTFRYTGPEVHVNGTGLLFAGFQLILPLTV